MPYPEDELHSTEELILDLHPHWWFFAKSAAMLALAVILAIVTLSRGWPSWISVPVAVFVFATLVWFHLGLSAPTGSPEPDVDAPGPAVARPAPVRALLSKPPAAGRCRTPVGLVCGCSLSLRLR